MGVEHGDGRSMSLHRGGSSERTVDDEAIPGGCRSYPEGVGEFMSGDRDEL